MLLKCEGYPLKEVGKAAAESYFQAYCLYIAALLNAPELYRCTQLVTEIMYGL